MSGTNQTVRKLTKLGGNINMCGNLPHCLETYFTALKAIQPVWKPSRLSENSPVFLKTVHPLLKLSEGCINMFEHLAKNMFLLKNFPVYKHFFWVAILPRYQPFSVFTNPFAISLK